MTVTYEEIVERLAELIDAADQLPAADRRWLRLCLLHAADVLDASAAADELRDALNLWGAEK